MSALLQELQEWLRIPSVSTDGGDPENLERAAEWAVELVRAAGGTADVLKLGDGNPLTVGTLASDDPGAPTVLIYGHYDVHGPEPLELWDTPPFQPSVRDGRIYARGASDDKGGFLPLLHAACAQSAAGGLPVNVRVLVDGGEECFDTAAAEWVREDGLGADCAVVFDGDMVDSGTPALTVGTRGAVQMHVTVRTAAHDLHSGEFGGRALNALHVLNAMLATVLPRHDGRLRDELRVTAGLTREDDRAAWVRLSAGDGALAKVGGRPAYPGAGEDPYPHRRAEPSLDVNLLAGGAPRAVIPSTASATLTMRLVPGQHAVELAAVLKRLLRASAPKGAEIELVESLADPWLEVESPVTHLASQAIERACGTAPVFIRSGGSIPILAELKAAGIPAILTGFALPEDGAHAPNESIALDRLELAEVTAHELLNTLAGVPRNVVPRGVTPI